MLSQRADRVVDTGIGGVRKNEGGTGDSCRTGEEFSTSVQAARYMPTSDGLAKCSFVIGIW